MGLRKSFFCMILFVGFISGFGTKKDGLEMSRTACLIDDFSRLNSTEIHSLLAPSSYEELQSILEYAKQYDLKVSIAGSKHSQGGHAFYPKAIVVSLKKLNKVVEFDAENSTIIVQAGATWNEVQCFLNPHNKAVKIMQFASVFTVGGALSVNANGIDPNYGPFIESVRSIRILCACGSIVNASRTENSELFHLAIGGYGLFGIILDTTLEVVDNSIYEMKIEKFSLPNYVKFIKNISQDSSLGFHFACLGFKAFGKDLFSDVRALNFRKLDEAKLSSKLRAKTSKLYKENFVGIKKEIIKLLANTRWMKALYSSPNGHEFGKIVSRNNIMNPPASHSDVKMDGSTNMLQEYFIPVDGLVSFINELELITKKIDLNLMYVALRFIPKNDESFLSYTQTDRVGVVLFFNQKLDGMGHEKSKQWTQYLINTSTQLGGTYYLPSQLYADKEQIRKAHPKIAEFFNIKKSYDPQELFMNCFYKKYA